MFNVFNKLFTNKKVIYGLMKASAIVMASTDISIRKHLSNLYLRGSSSPADYGKINYVGDIDIQIPQAYGEYLDRIGAMFNVGRFNFEEDEPYRLRILFSILSQPTVGGLERAVQYFLKTSPSNFYGNRIIMDFDVKVLEGFKDYMHGQTSLGVPIRSETLLYGITIEVTPKIPSGSETKMMKNINIRKMVKTTTSSDLRSFIKSAVPAGISNYRVVVKGTGALGAK